MRSGRTSHGWWKSNIKEFPWITAMIVHQAVSIFIKDWCFAKWAKLCIGFRSCSIITYSWVITLSWEVQSSHRLESFESRWFHHQVFQGKCPPSVIDLHAEFCMLHSQQSKPVSDMRFCNHLIETKEWNIEHNNTYNVWNIHNRWASSCASHYTHLRNYGSIRTCCMQSMTILKTA